MFLYHGIFVYFLVIVSLLDKYSYIFTNNITSYFFQHFLNFNLEQFFFQLNKIPRWKVIEGERNKTEQIWKNFIT